MFVIKLKIATTFLLMLGVAAMGVGTLAHQAWARRNPEVTAQTEPSAHSASRNSGPQLASGQKQGAIDYRFKAEEAIAKSFQTKGLPRVVVETFNGAIDVATGANGIVKVKVIKNTGGTTEKAAKEDLKNMEVVMNQDGDTIRITYGG
jgi:hypothetical protein